MKNKIEVQTQTILTPYLLLFLTCCLVIVVFFGCRKPTDDEVVEELAVSETITLDCVADKQWDLRKIWKAEDSVFINRPSSIGFKGVHLFFSRDHKVYGHTYRMTIDGGDYTIDDEGEFTLSFSTNFIMLSCEMEEVFVFEKQNIYRYEVNEQCNVLKLYYDTLGSYMYFNRF